MRQMNLLSPRLQLKIQQKQILTPGLVQMVTVLQLNRLELRELITQEIAQNPVLEETGDEGEELTPAEVQALLEVERDPNPTDQEVTNVTREAVEAAYHGDEEPGDSGSATSTGDSIAAPATAEMDMAAAPEEAKAPDAFDEIDFGSYFEDYNDPGFRTANTEDPDKPGFETFLSSPVTLNDYLQQQLSLVVISDEVREAADAIIGNLDETGYLNGSLDEISAQGPYSMEVLETALKAVQSLDPAGIAARSLHECLLLQLESAGGRGGVAWQIVEKHLKLVEQRNIREICRLLGRPQEHIQIALNVIRHLDPKPGLRFSGPGARQVTPDIAIYKDGDDFVIQLNDDEMPQLRLNGNYRRMLDREKQPDKDIRNYIKERYASALQLIRNIEQRKQTILKVCQAIVQRQTDFLNLGIQSLKPMMIKEVAEEIGVHPSTVSRAVAGKYAHTPQGVFELRYFFSEAVQGPSGGGTPLLLLKMRVKKMIEEEDTLHPLTDDQITARLRSEGIQVTRRTVAKYREDLKIPSTHVRRRRD
jgi:RNA polymerase sigma-54 factor